MIEEIFEECPQCNEMTLRDDHLMPDCLNCGYSRPEDDING